MSQRTLLQPAQKLRVPFRAKVGCGWPVSLWGLLLAATISGCETPGWAERLDESFSMPNFKSSKASAADEEQHRKEYAASRERVALYWLLHHRIESGMGYHQVCQILGEDGVRESRDNWVKTGDGSYQVGDDVYAFGPDSEGQTLYLVFRDNKLVNFDPDEFKDASVRPRPAKTRRQSKIE
jgi:hypothetical protein